MAPVGHARALRRAVESRASREMAEGHDAVELERAAPARERAADAARRGKAGI